MATLPDSPASSEHWLTIMTCTICESIPDSSPLYRCSMGHSICNRCFDKLVQDGYIIKCKKCNSKKFKQCIVSNDFLNKLKIKPGIGRRRRYRTVDMKRSALDISDFILDEPQQQEDDVTVEKLFRLTSSQISQLFEVKGKNLRRKTGSGTSFAKGDAGVSQIVNENVAPVPSKTGSLVSKKPLTCPHYDCKKLVTISSFAEHFHYDHSDIPSFPIERGKTTHMFHDVRMIEFNTTFCLAVLYLYEKQEERSPPLVPLGTFWILISGSIEEQKNKSYVLYWVSTDSNENFKCTIEMSSLKENLCSSTFCSVNKIRDSYNVADVAYRLNCLNLCYYSLCNLLQEGYKLHLRVTVH